MDDSGNPAKLEVRTPREAGPPASTSTRRRITPLRRRPPSGETYFVFELLSELPLELPDEVLPELLGEVVELGDVVELLLPPLAAPEPDLLKCASHSERDTWPSLFVSTEEKSGLDELLLEPDIPPLEPLLLEPPDAALPEDLEVSDEPDELLPDAAGEDEDEELCATATLDSANSAAAVAALRTLSFMKEPPGKR